jgi:predicted ATPase
LQANLGDVLINATSGFVPGRQLIIETHSEHILLRLLKRVRQTAEAKNQWEYSLWPDEVGVYYFNPSPDGTTIVTRMRVSEEGDFLDRWPRGFFAERDQEFFDE